MDNIDSGFGSLCKLLHLAGRGESVGFKVRRHCCGRNELLPAVFGTVKSQSEGCMTFAELQQGRRKPFGISIGRNL